VDLGEAVAVLGVVAADLGAAVAAPWAAEAALGAAVAALGAAVAAPWAFSDIGTTVPLVDLGEVAVARGEAVEASSSITDLQAAGALPAVGVRPDTILQAALQDIPTIQVATFMPLMALFIPDTPKPADTLIRVLYIPHNPATTFARVMLPPTCRMARSMTPICNCRAL
jgi:hypothetical protein